MRLYDDLYMVVEDRDFADLFPARERPAEAPVVLALATLLQFMEGLTDRQAADAVRTRIDWKYLLCLELIDAGFDHTVLSEFRTRLLVRGAERRLFDAILDGARGLLKSGGRQRSESTQVLGAMRSMSRLEVVGETLLYSEFIGRRPFVRILVRRVTGPVVLLLLSKVGRCQLMMGLEERGEPFKPRARQNRRSSFLDLTRSRRPHRDLLHAGAAR